MQLQYARAHRWYDLAECYAADPSFEIEIPGHARYTSPEDGSRVHTSLLALFNNHPSERPLLLNIRWQTHAEILRMQR